ncbi:MAG: SH3 domain-containing protein [Synergistaceae bacterium]|nr:SH3 domain-containing protein [Synergistaceae bacterium]
MAYALLVGNRTPEPRSEPIIIRPDNLSPTVSDANGENSEISWDASFDAPIIGPVTPASDASANNDSSVNDQFSSPTKRAAAYKVSNAALKKTVDQYAKTRTNHCAGEITVQTDDTPLNVRSGPAVGNPVITKAAKGSRQSVLLWAPDAKNRSVRWFLLVDDKTKAVKGWVSGEYCNTSGVVFAK